MRPSDSPRRRVYDFRPSLHTPGRVYLLPVRVYRALVPCIERGELNALELAVLRLARNNCCQEKEVAHALCMEEGLCSLVHFIQGALVQRGMLLPDSLAMTDSGRTALGNYENAKPTMETAILMVEEFTGVLLPAVLTGVLPSWSIVRTHSENSCLYDRGGSLIPATMLKPSGEAQASRPTATAIQLVMRRMLRENRRLVLPPDAPFFRHEQARGAVWEVAEGDGEASYLAFAAHADASSDSLLAVEDFFGRGPSPAAAQLLASCGSDLLRKELEASSTTERRNQGDKLVVKGFSPRLGERYPALAQALNKATANQGESSGRFQQAYNAAEHAFHAALQEYGQPGLLECFCQDAERNRHLVRERASQLGLSFDDKLELFHRLRFSRVRELLHEGGSIPTLDVTLACCIVAASNDHEHPFRAYAAAHPDMLAELSSMVPLRNRISHKGGDGEQLPSYARRFPENVHDMVRRLFPQFADASRQGKAEISFEQRCINAWSELLTRLGESVCQTLSNQFPTVRSALHKALVEESQGFYGMAAANVATAYQELLSQLSLDFGKPLCKNKDAIAERCRQAGLLDKDSPLPSGLQTVEEKNLTLGLLGSKSTLGGISLAFAARAPEEGLRSLAADTATRHFMEDMSRLCAIRGHGNDYGTTREDYDTAAGHLISRDYLSPLLKINSTL